MPTSLESHALIIASAQADLAALHAAFDYDNLTPASRKEHAAARLAVTRATRAAVADGYRIPQVMAAVARVSA